MFVDAQHFYAQFGQELIEPILAKWRSARRGLGIDVAKKIKGGNMSRRLTGELAAARTEIERLRATITEQAVQLHLHQGKSRWDS